MMAKTPVSILLISYVFLVSSILIMCESEPSSNANGFTTDLIHRDSPDSPLSDPSSTPWQRLADAKQRSVTRARRFNDAFQQRKSAEATVNGVDGTYLMRFAMGSELHHVIAIVDTGSDLIWTQCSPCQKCMRQLFPIFNPHSSHTYKDVHCNSPHCAAFSRASACDEKTQKCIYTARYGDTSYSRGDVATETFTFVSSVGKSLLDFKNIVFGCGHENYFHFKSTIAAGIVGLSGGNSSLVSQLGYDRFSYCLMPYGDRNSASKLHFGSDAEVSGGGTVSTPLTERNLPDYYFVTLEAISVGNKRLEYHNPFLVQGGNIVMDSGTLLTVLPINFYDDLEVAIANSIEQRAVRDFEDWRLCYSSAFEMPKITVHFKGADVEWKKENAFIRVNEDYVCLAVMPMEGLPVYGNVAQANYLVGYNLRKMEVYFKPSQCGK